MTTNAVAQAHAAQLSAQVGERDEQLAAAQARLEQRCSSFVYQLQSALSECTAVAEEHAAHTLQGIKKRVDDLQVRLCSMLPGRRAFLPICGAHSCSPTFDVVLCQTRTSFAMTLDSVCRRVWRSGRATLRQRLRPAHKALRTSLQSSLALLTNILGCVISSVLNNDALLSLACFDSAKWRSCASEFAMAHGRVACCRS